MQVLLGVWDEASLEAVDAILERTRAAGDDLTVAVLDHPDGEATAEELAEAVRDRLDGAAADVPVRPLSGHPGSTLVDLAEREGFDRVAVNAGSRSPLGKVQLGAVVEFVVLNATVTVTLVR